MSASWWAGSGIADEHDWRCTCRHCDPPPTCDGCGSDEAIRRGRGIYLCSDCEPVVYSVSALDGATARMLAAASRNMGRVS